MARSTLIREAADLLGTNPLADALAVSRRSVAYWQDEASGRSVPDGVLRELLPLLEDHICRTATLLRTVADEIGPSNTKDPAIGSS